MAGIVLSSSTRSRHKSVLLSVSREIRLLNSSGLLAVHLVVMLVVISRNPASEGPHGVRWSTHRKITGGDQLTVSPFWQPAIYHYRTPYENSRGEL